MIFAVLHGSAGVHHFCRSSWKEHYQPYHDKKILFVKYEDMLSSPLRECKRILNYLSLNSTDEAINAAIKNQSFEYRKKRFINDGDSVNAGFMHVGVHGQWEEILSETQKQEFIDSLNADLDRFSYKTVA